MTFPLSAFDTLLHGCPLIFLVVSEIICTLLHSREKSKLLIREAMKVFLKAKKITYLLLIT